MRQTEKAIQKRIEIAKEFDTMVIEHIKSNPASTIYEISKNLGHNTGRIQGSIKRIEHLLVSEQVIENGRLKKKFTLKENIIEE